MIKYPPPPRETVYVTKPFLPPKNIFIQYVDKIFECAALTNQGPLLHEFESRISSYLGVKNFHYLANGTLALQLALSCLEIDDGEVITTPFSYVATLSSIIWQRCTPVFVDIEPRNFTIDVLKIEAALTPKTRAILAVHVFGYACDTASIEKIAAKYNLKVIYDGAHAFGSRLNGQSLLNYGDVSTLSFHATKLFHTVEGGACVTANAEVSEKLELQKRFGHNLDDYKMPGINAKASEFHAAMGLSNFQFITEIIDMRKSISRLYDNELSGCLARPAVQEGLEYNYAYYPVLFNSEAELQKVFNALGANNIFPRRYFYPSLNTLPYVEYKPCPVSEDISRRIACLPLFFELEKTIIQKICGIIKENI